MPRPRKPPHLILRKARQSRKAIWVILDNGREISTGLGERDKRAARAALAYYVDQKAAAPHFAFLVDMIREFPNVVAAAVEPRTNS